MFELPPVLHRGARLCTSHLPQDLERPKSVTSLFHPTPLAWIGTPPVLTGWFHGTRPIPLLGCCLSTASSLHMLGHCPSPANAPGCTCGRVSVSVATASTIRVPKWCNDKKGPWLSVISSSISIHYPHRHERHRADAHRGMQFSHPPRRHTFGGCPLIEPCC